MLVDTTLRLKAKLTWQHLVNELIPQLAKDAKGHGVFFLKTFVRSGAGRDT